MRGSVGRRAVPLLAVLIIGLQAHGARAADLMDLYAKARASDPTILSARAEQMIADESLREAKAAYKPTLNASGQTTKIYQDITKSDNAFFYHEGKTDYFNRNYSISLTQPLYQPEALSRIPQAKVEVQQARSRFAAAEQDMIFRLAQMVFGFLAASDNLDLATSERMAIWQQLEESEQRLGSGMGTLTDVHEARARFALAQAKEIDARDALEESRQAIAEMTGEPPTEVKKLSETFPLVAPDRPEVESWIQAAMFQNPTITALQAAVEIADREVHRQRAVYRPHLDLVAAYDDARSGGTTIGSGGNYIESTNLSLRLGIPILDGGRSAALSQTASLRHEMAIQDLEKTKRRVDRETRAAFQGVIGGMTRVQALTQSVFSQESAVSAKEQGFRSGVNTGLAVLDARKDLFTARKDLAQSRYLYILNSLKLKQSAGSLQVEDLRQINAYFQ